MNSCVHGLRSLTTVWMQLAPKLAARRTPFHETTGPGAFHRRLPTGGAANGIPLQATTDAVRPDTPALRPPVTRTDVPTAAESGTATAASSRSEGRRIRMRTSRGEGALSP